MPSLSQNSLTKLVVWIFLWLVYSSLHFFVPCSSHHSRWKGFDYNFACSQKNLVSFNVRVIECLGWYLNNLCLFVCWCGHLQRRLQIPKPHLSRHFCFYFEPLGVSQCPGHTAWEILAAHGFTIDHFDARISSRSWSMWNTTSTHLQNPKWRQQKPTITSIIHADNSWYFDFS